MNSSTIVLVLILGCSIGIADSATTTTPKTKQAIRADKSNQTATGVKAAANNGTRPSISLRQSFGSIEEPCQCVPFTLCESTNVIDGANLENPERCSTDNVCCRMEPSTEAVAPSSPVDSASSPTTSSQVGNCICVPFYQCIDYQVSPVPPVDEEANIESIITPKFDCVPPDFCCAPDKINTSVLVTNISVLPPATFSTSSSSPVEPPSESINVERVTVPSESSSSSPPPAPQVEPECGIKGVTSEPSGSDIDLSGSDFVRITNNNENAETVFGEFPWMVALFRSNEESNTGELICGASLLSPYIVLTAAHCVNNIPMSSLRVRAGEYNIGSSDNETLPHQDRAINAVHIHPNFNAKRLHNDVALLRVSEPFHYESHVNSICAPLANTPYAAPNSYDPKHCWATGWGKSNINDVSLQHKLKKVELPIMKREECQQKLRTTKLGKNFVLDGSFICAGGQKGFDSCKGDGGGPLFCQSKNNDKKFIQVGIVSWGVGCATEIPGIYASLEANSEWLKTEMNTMLVFKPQ